MEEKEIVIKEREDGRIHFTVKGFTQIEVLGLLRLFEQQRSVIALSEMVDSKVDESEPPKS